MLIFTAHAQHRMTMRQIERAWIQATIDQPERSEPDPRDRTLTRAWRRIPERGNRVLRVVFRRSGDDIVVVSCVFDRGARRRWQP